MDNELYFKFIPDAGNDERGGRIIVTEEVNCFIVWYDGDAPILFALAIFAADQKEDAIRCGVDVGRFPEQKILNLISSGRVYHGTTPGAKEKS